MSDLDPVIHAPARLRLCAMLSVVDEAQFVTVRERLDVSDSVLSKHVSALTEARYVTVRKAALDGRRTTWLALTSTGRKALNAHVAALREVIDSAQLHG